MPCAERRASKPAVRCHRSSPARRKSSNARRSGADQQILLRAGYGPTAVSGLLIQERKYGGDDGRQCATQPDRQGGRLHPRPQHADRRRLVHAADHLGLCHLARHARLHRRRLVHGHQAAAAARRHVDLQRRAGDRRRRRAHLPDVADAARDVRRQARPARAAGHLPALCVPRRVVDRLRLRLLVEPDLRRGGDAHRPRRPAGGCARRQRRRRRAARCRARASSTAW